MNYASIILAAGHGERMHSKLPKVLHKIGNFSMLDHIICNTKKLGFEQIAIVADLPIIEQLSCLNNGIEFILQKSILGTGDAVKTAMRSMTKLSDSSIIVVQYGDTPLIKSSTISSMVNSLDGKSLVCLGFKTNNKDYGRLAIKNGSLKEVSKVQKNNRKEFLANAGIMVTYAKNLRELVSRIKCNKLTKEYDLTDIVSIAVKSNLNIGYIITEEEEAIGINNKSSLAQAEFFFQESKRKFFTSSGVILIAPETVFFSLDTQVGVDSIIYPYVFFGPGVKIGSNARIGPFTKCENTVISDNAILGSFVEVKASNIQMNTKIKHLSYIGNTKIGPKSNIGAGTVICNFDGKKKHKTNIGSNCFVGANSSLIAPLNIQDNSVIAAGSVIVKDVPKGSLAISREKQVIKKLK